MLLFKVMDFYLCLYLFFHLLLHINIQVLCLFLPAVLSLFSATYISLCVTLSATADWSHIPCVCTHTANGTDSTKILDVYKFRDFLDYGMCHHIKHRMLKKKNKCNQLLTDMLH